MVVITLQHSFTDSENDELRFGINNFSIFHNMTDGMMIVPKLIYQVLPSTKIENGEGNKLLKGQI